SSMAAHINREVEDRLEALRVTTAPLSQTLLTDRAALQAYLRERPILQRLFNGGVVVLDADGTAIAEVAPEVGRVGVNYRDIASVASALQQGTTVIGPPVMGKRLGAPVFDMVVPIRDAQGQVIGALSGLTHLGMANFIDSIGGASYGTKTSYMLVAKPQRLVVTATDKKRAMERLPAPGVNRLLDRFIQGYEGYDVTVNPLGTEVLAAARGIPATGWYLAVALPTTEAFAPIHDLQRHLILATLLLTVLAGILTWWLIKRQLDPMMAACVALARMSESDAPTAPLPITRRDEVGQLVEGFNRLLERLNQRKEALRQSEAFKNIVLNSVAAEIAVLNGQGVIHAVNEPWRRFALDNAAPAGFAAPGTGVGTNYLVVCDTASGAGAELAQEAGRGIRSVLQNSAASFSLEYPCHSPQGKRWFTMNVTPLGPTPLEGVVITHTNVTELKLAEEALRIAAIAFECQEAIAVLSSDWKFLRVNQTFTLITGYREQEMQGLDGALLRSDRHPATSFDAIKRQVLELGLWQGDLWQRRKDGEEFPAHVAITAVRDAHNTVTHYVCSLVDTTDSQLREQKRLADEAAHREVLIREVHHRIKNSLQGILGVLRQSAQQHPETAESISAVIGQVQSISVTHGLRGLADPTSVQLCELTGAIAAQVSSLWQTPVKLDIPECWQPCTLAEQEAVPMALVLNELIHNAIKHGGKVHGDTRISIRKGERPDQVLVSIANTGTLDATSQRGGQSHSGLKLVQSLLPRSGVRFDQRQVANHVITELHVEPPVITLKKESLV
ncbi:MAG: hypothetical protein RLZ81_558, partial [Pseudomonadota bacterium]